MTENFRKEAPAASLMDLCGRAFQKKVFQSCMAAEEFADFLALPKAYGFLVSGSLGVGKTTLAEAFAGDMAEKGYSFFCLPGDGAEDVLDGFLAECRETPHCFALLKDFQRIEAREETAEKLTAWLTGIFEEDLPVIFVITAEEAGDVPEVLKKELLHLPLDVPDKEEREEFFQGFLENIFILEGRFTYGDMAKETEGYYYTDLTAAILFIKSLMRDSAMEAASGDLKTAVEYLKFGTVLLTEEIFREALSHVAPLKPREEEVPETVPAPVAAAPPPVPPVSRVPAPAPVVPPKEEPPVDPKTNAPIVTNLFGANSPFRPSDL